MKRHFPVLAATICLLAAAPVRAQNTTVIPVGLADSPAASSSAYPFGASTPCRVQHWFGAQDTGLQAPIVIRGFEVRSLRTAAYAAKSSIDMQISLSTTTATRTTLTSTFATNHGSNLNVAYVRKMTSINATSVGWVGGYTGVLLFDTPFLYLPSQGNLLIDMDVASLPAGSWSSDQPSASLPTAGLHFDLGAGCGGLVASSTGGVVGWLGATSVPVTFSLTGGVANAPALLLFGVNVLPTPIPVPGNPTCLIFQDFPIVLSQSLTASGTGSAVLPVPTDPALRGLAVLGQWAAAKTTAPLVIETSTSRRVVLNSVWDVARVYSSASNTATTGLLQQYAVSVTRLHH